MGFTIRDLDPVGGAGALDVNAWQWRPTLEIIESLGFGDETRAILMHYSGVSVEFDRDEARAIARAIRERYLPRMGADTRLTADGGFIDEPDRVGFHRDDLSLNYSATRPWLEQFCEFCERCQGFAVN